MRASTLVVMSEAKEEGNDFQRHNKPTCWMKAIVGGIDRLLFSHCA